MLILGVFLLAGFVKGVIGLGLPTVAMGLLTLAMAPAEAAALLVLPSLVTNLVQVRPWREAARLGWRLRGLLAGVVGGTLLGLWLWGGLGGRHAGAALGGMLALYAALGLSGWKPHLPPAAALPVGVATGAVTAATGVFVLPAVPWLQAQGLGRDGLVRALGLSFTVSTLALAGLVWPQLAALGWAGLLAVAPALLGQRLGEAVRGRLSESGFRRCFLLGLLALGLWLLGRG
ncbi:sulfite exporter TauE/SafE family protein [Roseococcus sp. DSY-14]|uniref:sulfite exporter TauE/SafE family protein n=1 Tax=Roseococcus sp. DSY-14 TaxID=3369650 RepID=UPI00387B9BF4